MNQESQTTEPKYTVQISGFDTLALVSAWLLILPFAISGSLFAYGVSIARGWDGLGYVIIAFIAFPLLFLPSLITGIIAMIKSQLRKKLGKVIVIINSVALSLTTVFYTLMLMGK